MAQHVVCVLDPQNSESIIDKDGGNTSWAFEEMFGPFPDHDTAQEFADRHHDLTGRWAYAVYPLSQP